MSFDPGDVDAAEAFGMCQVVEQFPEVAVFLQAPRSSEGEVLSVEDAVGFVFVGL